MSQLIDDSLFEKFASFQLEEESEDNKHSHNICPSCDMLLSYIKEQDEQSCGNCGFIRNGGGEAGITKGAINGCIRVMSKNNKVRVYSIATDNSRLQQKSIVDLMMSRDNEYPEQKIPKGIIMATVNIYNEMQKNIVTEEDKPFVKRGSIRHEVLASILFYKCIEMGSPRRKRDIATYMQLQTSGFCRGEQIMRNIMTMNKGIDIKLDICVAVADGFASRYLAMLGIDPKYEAFIVDFIAKTEEINIGMASQTSSKVAGVIWILIRGLGLKFSRAELEKATNGCKQNTYMKYCNAVAVASPVLEPIFKEYGVNMNFGSK